MYKVAVLFSFLAMSSNFTVTCEPMKRHLLAKPSPALPSPAPPWTAPPSSVPTLATLDIDKTPLDKQEQTMHETSQEENDKVCQKSYTSTDYFYQPVLDMCLPCTFCVNNDDSYCEVCKRSSTVPSLASTASALEDSPSTTDHQQIPETESITDGKKTSSSSSILIPAGSFTVPSLASTASAPEDSPSTTDHQQTSETESITDGKKTSSPSSILIPEWLLILLIFILVGLLICGLLYVCRCVIKRNKRVADRQPSVKAQAIPTTPATPEEAETCLDGINVDNIDSGLSKPLQDTDPVPPFHPMVRNSYSSSLDSIASNDSYKSARCQSPTRV